jgi:transcriptional regulator with XRE-family HTH domain
MVPSADGAATLAAALRKHRRAAGLSQERLAQQSGVSDRTIRNIEGGRVTTPRLSSLRALADALGIGGDERVRLMELATPDDEADVMEVGPGGRIPVPLTPWWAGQPSGLRSTPCCRPAPPGW